MDPRTLDRDFLAFRDRGSAEGLARVFDALAPRLLLVAGHLTRDAARAEDLVQSAFLQAMRDAAGYDGTRPVGAWLAGILRHRALDERRRAQLRAAEPLDDGAPAFAGGPDPADVVADRELYERVVAAAMELAEPYRTVLALRIVHGLEPVAIAHALGRAPGTVRMQLKRGLDELRRAAPAHGAFAALVFGESARGLGAVRAAVLGEAAATAAAAGALGVHTAAIGGWLGMKMTLTVCAAALAAVVLFWIARAAPRAAGERVAAAPEAVPLLAAAPQASLAPPGAAAPRAGHRVPEAPAAAAAGAPSALDVRVTFASDGAPAAGAGVYLRPETGGFGHEARADGAGRASFHGLEPGAYMIYADRDAKHARAVVLWPSETSLELMIPPGLALSGRVVDRDGNGVEGARVYRENPDHHDRLQALAVTGAGGTFELRDVAGDIELLARADGFQPSELEHVRGKGAAPVELELALGALGRRLRGRVLGPAGEPAPFAWVALGVDEDARKEAAGSSRGPLTQRGKPLDREGILLRADAQGRFETREVPGGHTLVLARAADAAGDGEQALVGWRTLWVQGDVEDELEVELAPGAEVAGTVRDASGHPAGQVRIEAEWEGTGELGQMEDDLGPWISDASAVTAADGTYRLTGLLPGDYDLRVWTGSKELTKEERVLAAREQARWDPVVDAAATLDVFLFGPDGRPLSSWTIAAGERPVELDGQAAALTDTHGSVRLVGLPAGGEVAFSLFAPRFAAPAGGAVLPAAVREGVPVPVPEGGAVPRIELRLDARELPTARLSGRVVGEGGAPVAGVRITLERPGLPGEARLSPDEDGGFAFEGLAAGEVCLSALAPGWSVALPLRAFELAPDESLDAGTLHLPASARLSVRVLAPDGAAQGRVLVELLRAGGDGEPLLDGSAWERTEDGFAAAVPAGDYLLRTSGGVLAPSLEPVRVEPPLTEITVRRARGEPVPLAFRLPEDGGGRAMARVHLRILDAAGECLHHARWVLSSAAGAEPVTPPALLHLLPGAYRVRAELEDGRAVESELAVPRPADAAPLLLDLR